MNVLLNNLLERYPKLVWCKDSIESAGEIMVNTYKNGGKILVCGNGGSSSDAEHIVGELMKGFMSRRPMNEGEIQRFVDALGEESAKPFINKLQGSLPAIALTAQSGILSAFANDVDADFVYAQLVYGYAKKEDLVIGISTSGNSKNVVNAIQTARALGVKSISLTGKKESLMSKISTVTIMAPETETYKVQELHLPVYHYLCSYVENNVFGDQ